MSWEKKVEDWLVHPVTIQFRKEIESDLAECIEGMINPPSEKTEEITILLRGMVRALRGVLDMGLGDPILSPGQSKIGE